MLQHAGNAGKIHRLRPCRAAEPLRAGSNATIVSPVSYGGRPRRCGQMPTMQRHNERDLREQLVKLRAEHRELDDEIVRLESGSMADQLIIKRLKKRKLALKDQITAVEDQLLPDIIA